MLWRAWLTFSIIGQFLLAGVHPDLMNAEIVTDVSAAYKFGQSITFDLSLNNAGQISGITIFIEPDSQAQREIPLAVTGQDQIQYVVDLQQDPIRPFSRVYYWFEVKYSDGSSKKSPSFWFDYVDDAFTWKTNSNDLFVVHYIEQDASFIQDVQNIARDGLKEATKWLPVVPKLPIQIYLYPDLTSLQSALSRSQQAWTAGHADPELGVVLVSLPGPGQESPALERQIPHELMHILQYTVMGASYDNAPAWLLEGLASVVELYPDPDRQRALQSAFKDGNLQPIESLCQPFAGDAQSAFLAYAESQSFVSYLSQRFGSSTLSSLLDAYSNGLECNSGVQKVYSLPLATLDQNWREAEFSGKTKTLSLLEYWPVAFVSALVIIPLLVIAIRAIIRSKNPVKEPSNGRIE